MRTMIAAALSACLMLLLPGCADTLPRQYGGADGGYLVAALGEPAQATGFWWSVLMYRPKTGKEQGTILFSRQNLLKPTPLDFDDAQGVGFVEVRKLPPGDYELFNFEFKQVVAGGDRIWRARSDFSIPFTIRPGAATYLGSLTAHSLSRRNALGGVELYGGYFVVTNQQQRDLAVARQKVPALGQATVSPVRASGSAAAFFRHAPP